MIRQVLGYRYPQVLVDFSGGEGEGRGGGVGGPNLGVAFAFVTMRKCETSYRPCRLGLYVRPSPITTGR